MNDATATRERINVTVRCGPLEPSEQEVLLGTLRQFAGDSTWPDIHYGPLTARGSARVHVILSYLLPAISPGGLDGLVATPSHELRLQLEAAQLGPVGQLARQLEALRTPFSIAIHANDSDSGAVRASWELGLDQPSVALLGDVPTDPGWRHRLLSQMEDLLAGDSGGGCFQGRRTCGEATD